MFRIPSYTQFCYNIGVPKYPRAMQTVKKENKTVLKVKIGLGSHHSTTLLELSYKKRGI